MSARSPTLVGCQKARTHTGDSVDLEILPVVCQKQGQ